MRTTVLYLCGLPLQIPKPQSSHEKKILDKIPTEGYSEKYQYFSKWSRSPKTKNCWESVTATSEEVMTTKCNVVS